MARAMLALAVFAGLAAAVGPPRPRVDLHGDPLPPGAVARLGSARWRTEALVYHLACSPDGKWVAAVTSFGLTIFDADGRPVARVPGARSRFETPVFSPDGKLLAVNLIGYAVHVYEAPTGRRVQQFGAEGIRWYGWSADRRLLGVKHADGALLLRDLASGKQQRLKGDDLPDPRSDGRCYAFAPRAKLLAVRDKANCVQLWDTGTGRARRMVRPEHDLTSALVFSPDGRRLATLSRAGGESAVELWDLATKKVALLATNQSHIDDIAFSPDGKSLATASAMEIGVWDVAAGKERRRVKGTDIAYAVTFHPDGKTLIRATHSTIQLWDAATGKQRPAPVGHTGPALASFSPDGRRVLSKEGDLHILWDATTGKPLRRFADSHGDLRVRLFHPGGRLMLHEWVGEKLTCADAETGKVRFVLKITDPGRPKSPHEGRSVWLADDGQTLVTMSQGRPPKGDGGPAYLIAGWDAATGQPRFRRRREHSNGTRLLPSPDARVLAVSTGVDWDVPWASGTGPVQVEDMATGEVLMRLAHQHEEARPTAFSPDGRFLVIQSRDMFAQVTLHVRELASAGEVLARPAREHDHVVFAPDGAMLALTAPRGEAVVWDLRRGREARRLRPPAAVHSLAFSPDGGRLVTGLGDATLLIWDIAGPKGAQQRLDPRELSKAWDDLAGDPKAAFAARGRLALAPADAVPLLAARLKPTKPPPAPAVLKGLIAELDDDAFATREAARRELEQLGDAVAGALRQALKAKPSLEAYRRIEALLRRQSWPLADGDALRQLRGVAALEDIGDAAAVKHLKALAAGAAGSRLTEDARASLARLARRPRP